MELVAYKCMECGHFTISSHDGMRCAKCQGPVTPAGHATYCGNRKGMAVTVSVKDMDVFKEMVRTMAAIANDKDAPEQFKAKIRLAVERACRGETEE